jgi:Ca2+-binding RTX toxin-like protein
MKILGDGSDNYLQDKIGSDDFVFGFGGDDTIEDDLRMSGQRPSDDHFYGGRGRDHLSSLLGSDRLYGQGGNDELDVWKGGVKRVIVDGGGGEDFLTLWGFDEDRATVRIHEHRTVVEQGSNKVVIHTDVEHWEFF